MKYLKIFWLFFSLIFCHQFGYSQATAYIQIASITFETPYFDRVEILKDSFPGPGDFHKVNIYNRYKLVFSFDEILDSIAHESAELRNLSKSDLFFLIKLDNDYVFMFFGYPFASSPRKMILIRADKRGLTKFFDDEFELSEVSWLNDHTMLINGRPVIPQGLGPAGKNSFVIGTYAPSLVYQLNDNLILDSVRTIKRNKEN